MNRYKIKVNGYLPTQTTAVSAKAAINNVLFNLYGKNKEQRDLAVVEIVWTNDPNCVEWIEKIWY